MSTTTESFIRNCLAGLERTDEPDLVAAFLESSGHFAELEAFKCLGHSVTFAEVESLTRDFAAYLLGEGGLQHGDRIAIQLPNLVQYPIVAWGALRAGLTIVNTNPLYTRRELIHQFSDSGAKTLVCLSDRLDALQDVLPETDIENVIATSVVDMINSQALPDAAGSHVVSLPDALKTGSELELPEVDTKLEDIALLQYTGGTTGAPKGAILTYGNLMSASLMSTLSFGSDRDTREIGIAPMPLYHIYGFAVNLVSGFLNGGLSVLIPNPRDTDTMIATMRQEDFTSFAGVNTLFTSLMQHPEFDTVNFSYLERTIAGGAATVEEIASEWQARTGCKIYEGYGLSETSAMATVNTLSSRQLGTIGPAMRGTELKVVDEDGNDLPNGEEGELLLRGPQVMRGYWQREDANAEVFDAQGWFRTGDVAVIQDDGHVRIVDRLKDMILVSGFNVYPNEIESVVFCHPDVVECAVVGMTDEKTGEAVKLCVVTSDPNLTADALRDFCRADLAAYKVPKIVEFMDDLPKSTVGKILRRELRDAH